MNTLTKFPKVNQVSQSLAFNSPIKSSNSQQIIINLSQVRQAQINKNIFVNNTRQSGDSSWIINKLDNNSERIINAYKNDSNLLQAEVQKDETKAQNSRRKRMLFSSNKTESFGLQQEIQQEYQLPGMQPREKLTTPSNNQSNAPHKKRSVKRSALYFEQSDNESQEMNYQSDNSDTLSNSTKESMTSLSDFSINKSTPFFARKKQQNLKSACSIGQEDSYYNFVTKKKNNIVLPPIHKGILKISSEGNITKHSQKSVSFKPKIQFF